MATTQYITLTNSTGTLSKRFRVLAEGYDDGLLEKATSVQKTIDGSIDVCQGGIYKSWNMTIRVAHTETDSNYGTLADLETLFSYNNPAGAPSDRITLRDHHNTTNVTVIIMGSMQKSLLSAYIEGISAWYLVQLQLLRVQ